MVQTVEAFHYDDCDVLPLAARGHCASVSVFADRHSVRSDLTDRVLEAGLVLRQAEPLQRLTDGNALVLGDVAIVDAPVPDAELLAAFARLDMRAARSGTQLIVSTGPEGLDAVFGCFDQSDAQILVTPGEGDRALALGSALARLPVNMVRELSGEDRVALVRLTEQVQMLARKMEGLSADRSFLPEEREDGRSLRSPGLSYNAPPSRSDRKSEGPDAAALPSPVFVREIIRQRQLRTRFFDPELFADPAWDILLDLTAARAEGKQVSVSSLCIAAAVPPTTALRWISQMTETGLLDRVRDPADRRRAFIELSDSAAGAMAAYFEQLDNGAAVV